MPDMDGAADADPQGEREVLYWYDPMRPERHFDKPGKSPFMDMQLVPKYADEAGTADAGPTPCPPPSTAPPSPTTRLARSRPFPLPSWAVCRSVAPPRPVCRH